MPEESKSPLVVIVSNRGPFSFEAKKGGSFSYQRGQGGLVTALAGLIQHHEVLWVAVALSKGDEKWSQAHDGKAQEIERTRLQLVQIPRKAYNRYYNVISNPLLWFIQHQLWEVPIKPDIDRPTWDAWHSGYIEVNRRMAEVVAESVKDVEPDRPVII